MRRFSSVSSEMLGKSTQSRYFALLGREEEAPFPEDGYPGDYIDEIAREILAEHGKVLADRPLDETLSLFREKIGRAHV